MEHNPEGGNMREHKVELAEGDSISIKLEGYANSLEISWDHILETYLQYALNKVHAKRYQQAEAGAALNVGALSQMQQNRGFQK